MREFRKGNPILSQYARISQQGQKDENKNRGLGATLGRHMHRLSARSSSTDAEKVEKVQQRPDAMECDTVLFLCDIHARWNSFLISLCYILLPPSYAHSCRYVSKQYA